MKPPDLPTGHSDRLTDKVPSSKPLQRRRFQPGDNYLTDDLKQRAARPGGIKHLRLKERIGTANPIRSRPSKLATASTFRS
jgi:hypothetical protein